MRSPQWRDELEGRQNDARPQEHTEEPESTPEVNEDELDEGNLDEVYDDRWDAFILDDDGEPLPDYGDFWFPD